MPLILFRPQRQHARHLRGCFLAAGTMALSLQAASAQTLLGPATAGGIGLRGTNLVPQESATGLPAITTTDVATVTPTAAKKKQPNIPKLTNRALPERYPVPLPPLVPYARAQRPKGSELAPAPADAVPPPAVAVLPSIPRRTLRADDNPFGPIGFGVGNLRLIPYIEQDIGYDSNPDQVATGVKGSAYSRTEGGLAIQSDWAQHELKGAMKGGYNDFFNNPQSNRPDATGVLDLRIDATRDTKLDAEARFGIDTQRPGSPELNVAVVGRPLIETFGATVGATQSFGRFSVGLHGLADRTAYDNGVLSNGDPVDLAYQNVTDYGGKLRFAYDLKPGLQPFLEFGADRRIHDDLFDPSGYRRDSSGYGAKIGSSFEFWPQLTGTASVGYALRQYDDPRLEDLKGPTADASLIWAATPLTTITLNGSTTFGETTVIGSSGIKSYATGLALSHAFFRYLTLTAAVAYQRDEYIGAPIIQNTVTESLKAEYHLSRSLVLTGTLSHQQLRSTVSGSDYTQNIALIGLRLQH